MSDQDDHTPYDDIVGHFTTGDGIESPSEPPALLKTAPNSPAGDGTIEIALVGNLPIRDMLWPPQYVHRLSHDHGMTALVQFREDTYSVRLFPGGQDHIVRTLPEVFEDIDHAIDWLASNVRRLVVIPPAGARYCEIVSLEERLLIFTGADDPAVVASYKLLARADSAADLMKAKKLRASLVFFGSPIADSHEASKRIESTARRFMGVNVSWNDYSLQRVDAFQEQTREVPVEEGFGLTDFVTGFRRARSEAIERMGRDRFNDDVFESREALELEVPPEPSSPTPEVIDDEEKAALEAACDAVFDGSDADMVVGTITTVEPPVIPPPSNVLDLEVDEDGLITEPAKTTDAETPFEPSLPSEEELDEATLEAFEAVFDAPPAGPPTPETPVVTAGIEEKPDVPAGPSGSLLAHLHELRPVELSLPIDARIECGLDRHDHLHLIAGESDLRLLQNTVGEIRQWESVIVAALKCAPFAEGGLHLDLILHDAAANSDLHGKGINLHLLIDPETDNPRLIPLN